MLDHPVDRVRSVVAPKMIELLGSEKATRRMVMHLAMSGGHILTHEWSGPNGKLLHVRRGDCIALHKGDEHFYFEVVDGEWVEVTESKIPE